MRLLGSLTVSPGRNGKKSTTKRLSHPKDALAFHERQRDKNPVCLSYGRWGGRPPYRQFRLELNSEDHGPRSNAFHLIRLCMLLEHGGDPRLGENPQWFQGQIDGNRRTPFLEPAVDRGRVTIVDVHGAASPEEQTERVYR